MKEGLVKVYKVVMELLIRVWGLIQMLSAEEITFVSILVSFIIYILSKRAELTLKKYEAKKEKLCYIY